jgi:hypothetical protein
MTTAPKTKKTIEVFFSYSHKDEQLRDELSSHLAILKRRHVINGWHDRRIGAGREWEKEIDEHLNSSQIVLLLVSSDFLASDYCYDIEVKRAMQRHEAGEARVIPIILRDVDWKGAPFSRLKALPKDGKAITSWSNRDEAFRNVAEGIKDAVDEAAALEIGHLLAKFGEASTANWAAVIDLGERILSVLPDHQATRIKTSAAYIQKWAKKARDNMSAKARHAPLDEVYSDYARDVKFGARSEGLDKLLHSENPQHTDNYQMLKADLLRANELDSSNADFYYWRSAFEGMFFHRSRSDDEKEDERLFEESCRKLDQLRDADLSEAIRLNPRNGRYYYRRSQFLSGEDAKKDFARAIELEDPIALKMKAETERNMELSRDPLYFFRNLPGRE